MRLRELTYPILRTNRFVASRYNSVSKWNDVLAEAILDGSCDKDVYFDSDGREYRVTSLTLSNPSMATTFKNLAWNLFIPYTHEGSTVARVDGELELIAEHSLKGLKARIRAFLSEHPHLRSGVSRSEMEEELQRKIDLATSPKHVFQAIEYMEGAYPRNLKGSKIAKDLRTRKRSY